MTDFLSERKVNMTLDKILVVGKEAQIHQLAHKHTKQLFAADDTNNIWDLIDSVEPHLILLDKNIHYNEICSFLEGASKNNVEIPVVIIGGEDSHEHAEKLIKLGAYDFIKGKNDHNRLGKVIDRIIHAKDNNNPDNQAFFSESFFLQEPQEFCLKLQRHFADFIQKDRAAACEFE